MQHAPLCSRAPLGGRALRSIGVQAVVQRRASRGMQTAEHVCATCTALLALNQTVCQCQADINSSADGLLALASSANQASQARARLASEVATARERMARTGQSDLTEAAVQQREANVMNMLLNAEAKETCLEILASQRQELRVVDMLTTRHAEAVALEQTIMREHAALQHTAEARHSALGMAIHELGVWIQTHFGPAEPR